MKRTTLGALVATLLLFVAACSANSVKPSTPPLSIPPAYTPLVVSYLGAGTFPFKGTDGKHHVAYDVQLTNASGVPADLQQIDVVDAANRDRVLASLSGTKLVDPNCDYGDCNRLRMLPSRPVTSTVIPPQEARAVLIEYTLDSLDDAPATVLHRIKTTGANNPGATEPVPMDYLAGPVDVNAGKPRTILPPVTGTNWVAMNGCCGIGTAHVTALAPFSGVLGNSQRFAIDWMRTNDAGEFVTGDANRNENYHGYGQEIRAVADGIVVSTLDRLEPNPPGVLPASDPELAKTITVETVDGNNIILDLGDGVYAAYAHLQKGSLTVKPGDKVSAGQVIAKLGNTGNTNAPHLHFQLMNQPTLIGSDGIPSVIGKFGYAGYVDQRRVIDMDDFARGQFFENHLPKAEDRSDELPLNGAIVNFPDQ